MTPKEVIPKVQQDLFTMQDLEYRDFHAKLMPTVEKESVIGVRVPVLRTYAKKFGKTEEAKQFLKILPHQYYEENNLHGLLIEQIKDYELCIEELERFLPHIDNWATCDLLAVRTVKNHLNSYIKKIDRWLESEHIYTIRFGINMLMRYYLEEEFKLEYFATALAKKYDQVLPFLEEQKMDVWTHNKTIQKAIESYRITPEQKEYLRTLKIRQ